jgi:vitamin B12 transporter
MKKLTPLALAMSLTPAIGLAADTGEYDEQLKLSTVVVTADRQVQPAVETTSSVQVFTRADIDRLQPSTVADLLERVPGVQLTQSGGRGSLTGLFIRGTKSAQSLVLVDGVRINGAGSGQAALETLSVDQIERIEVLRGPRSVIYGADAIGGVVQIFTRRSSGQGLQPRLRLGYGSHDTWERSVGVSGGDENTRFSINASADETDGINRTYVRDGADDDRDAYRNNALSLNLTHRFNERWQAGLSVLDQRGETEYDQGWSGSYPYDEFQLSTYSGYAEAQLNEVWHSRLELGHVEDRRFNRYDDNNSKSSFNTYRDSVAWINDLQLNEKQALTVGADWYQEQLNGNSAFAETDRWNHAGFIQHRYQGEYFSTELGVRHDKNEIYGSENSWSGALTVPFNDRNQLILSYNEGFRAPTFVDLYYPGYDNPNLRPERSKSYELQWRSQLAENTSLHASIYRNNIDDAIVTDSSYTPYNIGSARINGFEASLQHVLFGWQGNLGISIIDPRDRDTGKVLNRRAKRTLNLDLDRQFGEFAFGASWLVVSRAWNDAANTQEIAGHGLLNLRGSWQASNEVRLDLKVGNLFDKQYGTALYSVYNPDWTVSNYPYREEGRTVMLVVTWTPEL